jgi:hypothetical protein
MTHILSVGRSTLSLFAIGLLLGALATFPGATYAHEDSKSGKSGTGVEVAISTNGSTLVRGAKVTSVSGSTINAATNYGSSKLDWTVTTDSNTEFASNNGGTGLSGIAVGDTVSFRGTLDQAVSGLTVKANVVKDWTQVETNKSLSGIVTSINTTLNSFTLSHNNATTTIQTNSSTDFELNGKDGSFASLFLNAKIKVKGFLNASSSVLTASEVDISSSSPKWGWDDKKEWKDWIKSKVWMNWR